MPFNWGEALEGAEVQPAGRDLKLWAMVRRLCEDGLIHRVTGAWEELYMAGQG